MLLAVRFADDMAVGLLNYRYCVVDMIIHHLNLPLFLLVAWCVLLSLLCLGKVVVFGYLCWKTALLLSTIELIV